MALAYRAGAPLKDMEFVQYHPTGLPFTGILITEAARAEGGWLLNKDGYRYLQDYDLGKPEPTPVLRSMELGPRDRLSQAFVHEVEKGRTDRHAVRPGRAPRPAPPRREGHRQQASVRARAVPEVPEHRPGQRAGPGPAGGALHDGRRTHRHRRRHTAGRPVRRGRGRLREHQRRQPAGLELAARAAGLRRPRRPGGRRVRRTAPPSPRAAVEAQAADEQRRLERDSCASDRRAASGSRPSGPRCRTTMEEGAGHLPRPASRWRRPADRLRELQERSARCGIDDHSRTFNTELVAALELADMLDVAETHRAQRPAARGVARRPPAHRLPRPATTSASSPTRWSTAKPTAARVEYLPVTITRWPPGERVYGR